MSAELIGEVGKASTGADTKASPEAVDERPQIFHGHFPQGLLAVCDQPQSSTPFHEVRDDRGSQRPLVVTSPPLTSSPHAREAQDDDAAASPYPEAVAFADSDVARLATTAGRRTAKSSLQTVLAKDGSWSGKVTLAHREKHPLPGAKYDPVLD